MDDRRDIDNEARADRADRVLDIYAQRMDETDRNAAIVDLVTDLLHLSEMWGWGDGAETLHRVAWSHFSAEKVSETI